MHAHRSTPAKPQWQAKYSMQSQSMINQKVFIRKLNGQRIGMHDKYFSFEHYADSGTFLFSKLSITWE